MAETSVAEEDRPPTPEARGKPVGLMTVDSIPENVSLPVSALEQVGKQKTVVQQTQRKSLRAQDSMMESHVSVMSRDAAKRVSNKKPEKSSFRSFIRKEAKEDRLKQGAVKKQLEKIRKACSEKPGEAQKRSTHGARNSSANSTPARAIKTGLSASPMSHLAKAPSTTRNILRRGSSDVILKSHERKCLTVAPEAAGTRRAIAIVDKAKVKFVTELSLRVLRPLILHKNLRLKEVIKNAMMVNFADPPTRIMNIDRIMFKALQKYASAQSSSESLDFLFQCCYYNRLYDETKDIEDCPERFAVLCSIVSAFIVKRSVEEICIPRSKREELLRIMGDVEELEMLAQKSVFDYTVTEKASEMFAAKRQAMIRSRTGSAMSTSGNDGLPKDRPKNEESSPTHDSSGPLISFDEEVARLKLLQIYKIVLKETESGLFCNFRKLFSDIPEL